MRDVIRGETQTVLRFLANAAYQLDYYQRDFVWTENHVSQFVDDLYRHVKTWSVGASPLPWYIGAVMIHQRGAEQFLVDGQQRCATILALLLALRARTPEGHERDDLHLALGVAKDRIRPPLADAQYRDVLRLRFENPAADAPAWRGGQPMNYDQLEKVYVNIVRR